MKTKKINLVQRLEVAKRNLNHWQRVHAYQEAREKNCEFERRIIKQYATYIKNACEMHDLTFSPLLL